MTIASALKSKARRTRIADSRLGIRIMGHREFIGALWDEMGEHQFRLMLDHGLRPSDVLLDVGCGSLRGGRLFIPYLEPGHYIGIDKYRELVERGLVAEVPAEVRANKRPQFIYTDKFELPALSPRPTFVLAQSLFSHLSREDAQLCLRNMRPRVADGCRFLVTFFESDEPVRDQRSHTHNRLEFTRQEMEAMGAATGWECRYVGEFGHPRGQRLVEYSAA